MAVPRRKAALMLPKQAMQLHLKAPFPQQALWQLNQTTAKCHPGPGKCTHAGMSPVTNSLALHQHALNPANLLLNARVAPRPAYADSRRSTWQTMRPGCRAHSEGVASLPASRSRTCAPISSLHPTCQSCLAWHTPVWSAT